MTTNNHPAHGPVSLNRLHQISEILSKASAQSDGGNLGYAMADAVKVIDGAIAALGAEPVAVNDDMAYAFHHALSDSSLGADEVEEIKTGLLAAFANVTAQPAPEVPDTLPCPVNLEPGLKFGKGVRTQCVLDALRRRADYYAELEAMTPEQRAEHDAGISEFKSMLGNGSRGAMLQSFGNSEQLEPLSHGEKLPMDYLQGHKDGLEWAAQLAEANHPQTGDWLYDDPIELARVIRKGPDMPPVQAGNSPVTPDCWVMVPKRLTAENGAKGVLSGEFSETKFINCPECFGDDDCETCDGSGRIEITVPVSWTNIKAIWAKGVEHFEAAPQQEAKS